MNNNNKHNLGFTGRIISNKLKSNYYSNKYATGRYRDNNNINDKIDTEINKINLWCRQVLLIKTLHVTKMKNHKIKYLK